MSKSSKISKWSQLLFFFFPITKSYTYLKTVLGISCGKDMYYDRYRKFFYLLSEARE